MLTKMPVGGVVWQTVHYLEGLRRLGFEVFYVEAHARTPSMLMTSEHDDASTLAARFIDRTLRPFGLADHWAYLALHDDGRCYGMSRRELVALYASAHLIINLHGGTEPMPEFADTGRLVYVETDPVQLQVELSENYRFAIDFLEPHCAFFTFGENIGAADCVLPAPERFAFAPTRQPVVLDFWPASDAPGPAYTTIGNWRQAWREVTFGGEAYSWSKHHEWEKVMDLPGRVEVPLELALASYTDEDEARLEGFGWRVVPAAGFSLDHDAYRSYVTASRGELTVAKDQNVRFRTGWFSDRSATYLAAGRPVVTQETGFSNIFPTGMGLLGFGTVDEAAAALETVEADPAAHRHAAQDIAREFFSADVVLRAILDRVGVELPARRGRPARGAEPVLPADTPLEPVSRRPTVLPAETVQAIAGRQAVRHAVRSDRGYKQASVLVVAHDGEVFTRLTVESVLAETDFPNYELVVVDNGSTDGTAAYLDEVAGLHPNVRVLRNAENRGFPAATNQALAAAEGSLLVLLNNDVLVTSGWLSRLADHVERRGDCLVGPVTNRIGNEAEIAVDYGTWRELRDFARDRAARHAGATFPIPTLTMFCLAMPRSVYERLGPLDEQFGVGTLEDDDYSMRARREGLALLCAPDVFVHHFGESSFGALVASGRRDAILAENRRRFAEKWGEEWQPYERRLDAAYEASCARVRAAVAAHVPEQALVLVVSRGDDGLLALGNRDARHFPQGPDGEWAGHYPADGVAAVAHLEALRAQGARYLVFPPSAGWWLEHYTELRDHLAAHARQLASGAEAGTIYVLDAAGAVAPREGAAA